MMGIIGYWIYVWNYVDPEVGILSQATWDLFLQKCSWSVLNSHPAPEMKRKTKF
jgi:hypothetical protein